jgi:hypothetical protein
VATGLYQLRRRKNQPPHRRKPSRKPRELNPNPESPEREKPQRLNKSRCAEHVFISPRKVEDATPYEAYGVRNLHPDRVEGMTIRSSRRWCRGWSSRRAVIDIPYIGECGKFSAFKLISWHCYPEQAVISVASTVYFRLLKVWRRRHSYRRDIQSKDKDLLARVASLYVTNHSDYFLDRALAVLTRPSSLKKLLDSFVRKLDDKFWFVYSQVSSQTYWLTFRSLGIRDKSRKEILANFMSEDSEAYRDTVVREAFSVAAAFHMRVKPRSSPYVQVKKLSRGQKSSLAFFFDWSDPEQ